MAWNLEDMDLFDGAGGERVSWQLDAEAGIADTIREIDPDILFIAEAPSYIELESFVMRNGLGYEVIHYRQQSGRRAFADSMALLHRLPVNSSSYITPLVPGSSRSEASAYLDWSYRGLLVVEFEEFSIIGVHFKSPWDGKERSYVIRDAQARSLLNQIDRMEGPLIVLGDFNDSPGVDEKEASFAVEDTITLLESELSRAPGTGFTQERGLDLDHIFVRTARIGNRQTGETDWNLSDHHPVWADVVF